VDELLALECRFWLEADGDLYREHAVEELVMVLPNPVGIVGLEQVLRAVDEAGPWDTVDVDEVTFVELTPDSIALAYRAIGCRGDADPYRALVASIYVRRSDGWLLAFHQQTPVG
jgi:hypothetical protein